MVDTLVEKLILEAFGVILGCMGDLTCIEGLLGVLVGGDMTALV
jgi:hypothetical protein